LVPGKLELATTVLYPSGVSPSNIVSAQIVVVVMIGEAVLADDDTVDETGDDRDAVVPGILVDGVEGTVDIVDERVAVDVILLAMLDVTADDDLVVDRAVVETEGADGVTEETTEPGEVVDGTDTELIGVVTAAVVVSSMQASTSAVKLIGSSGFNLNTSTIIESIASGGSNAVNGSPASSKVSSSTGVSLPAGI